MLQLVFCYGAFGFGYIIPATFVPVMAKQAIADPALFGWAWPVFGLTAAASTLLSAVWSRAGAYRRVWIVASAAMAAGVAAPVALPGLAGVLMAAIGVGGTFMVITMAGMQEAGRVAGAAAPALIGAMTAAFALGQIIGPLTAGLASDLWISHLIASALLVLSAVVLAIEPDERSSRG
jgi:predicted MFS family arabinose efflux permease